ncbi:MAG TPA: DUF6392 family protein [Pseudomonas sp.]|uniref:DUF6392 family protein n=1 Tax=Pseudomonas laurylsulfatiphila TaxID=2011015 RepID=UPI00215F01FD|nr:DUF6392 family protein [Pseudomonas laurylsulfatiphila]UVM02649.1 DUF6392 family protein [Pseudomonas laurylsulfatiphila]HJR33276.1 DUF6392 family protein [Pseudomonas sp.]
MNAEKIESWIKKLGFNYDELISQGVVFDNVLEALYPDADLLDMDLETGVSLSFWAETKKLETLFITLKKTMPEVIEYTGALPLPFALEMTQSEVHAIFGEPVESRGPVRMPEPMGQTGGWESYLLDSAVYPGKKVTFQYTSAMEVKTLVFTLIDKGHD